MSDYSINNGWYKYPSETTNHGQLINVYKTTKKFVSVKIYSYYDNKYDLTNMKESDLVFDFKRKVEGDYIEGGWIYPYPETKSVRSYKLCDSFLI